VGIGNKVSIDMDLEEAAKYMADSVEEVQDALKKLTEAINEMNAKQGMHFSRVSWTDEAKDGEKLYTVSVSLGAEHTEAYWNPDALAAQLGYQRGEFEGHSLKVWNETEDEKGVDTPAPSC
jgi:hypothetical protein